MCERSQIPKKDKIAELPVVAMIAFAARCARRVQPLFTNSWANAAKNHIQAIEDAISLAEETAKSGNRQGQKGINIYQKLMMQHKMPHRILVMLRLILPFLPNML